MNTWTKKNFNVNELSYDDNVIIGPYIIEVRGDWFKIKNKGSEAVHEFIQDVLGDNWVDHIYTLYDGLIASDKEEFAFSPTFKHNIDNYRFIEYLMQSYYIKYGDSKDKYRGLITLTRYNFESIDNIKENDLIEFSDDDIYRVYSNHLCNRHGSNSEILKKVYSNSYKEELNLLYGYEHHSGEWPSFVEEDYGAVLRVIKNIFRVLYFGYDKPTVVQKHRKEFDTMDCSGSMTVVSDVVSKSEPKLKNKKIKTFIISNDMISDEIKLI